MKIQSELESALCYFQAQLHKERFFEGLRDFSASLIPPLLSHFGASGQMVVQFIGQERILEIIEKNLILLAYRSCRALDSFDESGLEHKLAYIVDLLVLLSKEGEAWCSHMQETLSPVHNKKERRRRREGLHEVDLSQVIAETASALRPLLFPEGYDSLFLPAGAHMILSRAEKKIDYGSIAKKCVEMLFCRDNKMNLLYRAIAALHKKALSRDPISCDESIPQEIVDRLSPSIEPLVRVFVRPLASISHVIPKEMVASKLLLVIAGGVGQIRRHLFSVLFSSEKRHGERALVGLIERVSEDERAARALIMRCMPESTSLPKGPSPSFFELISFGLKNSASHFAVENILSSVDWKGSALSVLETIRYFVGSAHCDRWLLRAVSLFPFAN